MSSTSALSAPRAEGEVALPAERVEPAVKRGLRLAHLWAIVPLAVAWFASSIDYIEPFDFWWNLKSGEIMTRTGRFLAADVLVWTPVREPYYNPQWGSQLLFYWIYSLSPYLLLTLRALIVTATVGVILRLATWKSKSLRAATVATLIAYLASWTNYGMRPQLFAFLPFVAFLFLLERKDAYPRWLPLLVPLMLFWVNVHGSFFLGVAMLGVYGLGSLLEHVRRAEGRRWLLSKAAAWQATWLALAALATLANPYFVGIYNYFFVATNDPIARSLNVEWQSPTIYDGTGLLFFINVLIFAASLYASRRKLRPTEILLILAFTYLALTSLRNAIWWNWITAPMLAANFAQLGGRLRSRVRNAAAQETIQNPEPKTQNAPAPRRELPAVNWLLALFLVGGAVAFTPLWRQSNPFVPPAAKGALEADTPVKIAAFLKDHPQPKPLFNYMEWGGYMENALYPDYQMFIDGRFEARQVEVWQSYLSVSHARADWQNTLDRYGVRTLVLSKTYHKDLIPFVQASPTWHKVYEDKTGLIFTR